MNPTIKIVFTSAPQFGGSPPRFIPTNPCGVFRVAGYGLGTKVQRTRKVCTVLDAIRGRLRLLKDKEMIVYTLQVSVGAPTQFKIQVLNADDGTLLHAPIDDVSWNTLGVYETVDELEAALSPYLHMEQKT